MPTRHHAWPAGTPCWVDLATPDVAASCAFYRAVLGWTFSDPFEDFGGYVDASYDGEMAAGIGPTMAPGQATAWTVYFAVADADATAAAITGAGGTVAVPPFDVGALGRMAVAADPTGAGFGLWQAGEHLGLALYNAPGGLCWEEGWVGDLDRAKEFYTAVFGFTYTPLPGMDSYLTFATDGAELGAVGATDGPPHWDAYFGVGDIDAAVATAVGLGATVLHPVEDTPFGRLVEVVDPQGAAVKLTQVPV